MKRLALRLALALVTLVIALVTLNSCGACKHLPTDTHQTDSVRIEYRDRWIHDSVEVKVPEYIERVITRDTASHLENRIAVSDAVVSNGFLSHSLETKPQTIKVPVYIHVTDTLYIEKQAEIRTETIEVEKKLSWAQKTKLALFWWLVGLALIGWRREIIALVKYIIKLF